MQNPLYYGGVKHYQTECHMMTSCQITPYVLNSPEFNGSNDVQNIILTK